MSLSGTGKDACLDPKLHHHMTYSSANTINLASFLSIHKHDPALKVGIVFFGVLVLIKFIARGLSPNLKIISSLV
jgi:hypothetical protein